MERGWGMGKGLEAPRVERGGMGKSLEDRSGVKRTRALAYRPQERGAGDRFGVTRTRAPRYRPLKLVRRPDY